MLTSLNLLNERPKFTLAGLVLGIFDVSQVPFFRTLGVLNKDIWITS